MTLHSFKFYDLFKVLSSLKRLFESRCLLKEYPRKLLNRQREVVCFPIEAGLRTVGTRTMYSVFLEEQLML